MIHLAKEFIQGWVLKCGNLGSDAKGLHLFTISPCALVASFSTMAAQHMTKETLFLRTYWIKYLKIQLLVLLGEESNTMGYRADVANPLGNLSDE